MNVRRLCSLSSFRPSVHCAVVVTVLALALAGCETSNGGGFLYVVDSQGGNTTPDGGGGPAGGSDAKVGSDSGAATADTVGGDAGGVVSDAGTGDVGGADAGVPDASMTDVGTADGGVHDTVVSDGGTGPDDTTGPGDTSVPPGDEICDNGLDDDGDGAFDCGDDDCLDFQACTSATGNCSDFYDCLFEQRCDCEMDVDCPDAATADCPQATEEDQQLCLGKLSIDTQAAVVAFQSCLAESCADVTGDAFASCYMDNCTLETVTCFYDCVETETQDPVQNKDALVSCIDASCAGTDFGSCVNGICLEERTQCSYDGDATCEEGWFGCYTQCVQGPLGDDCRSECLDTFSVAGAYDFYTWNNCRFDLCDADGDGSSDSTECAQIAYLFACADVTASCVSEWPGTDTCAETTDCLLGCGGFGDVAWDCMAGCFDGVAEGSVDAIGPLWSCAVEACGTTSGALSLDCMLGAIAGPCGGEADACGVSLPVVELCSDGVDNDDDGAIDCEDVDCAAAAACDTTPETCGDFYDCLFEQTCDCTMGIDCPDSSTNCPQATAEQQQYCLGTLSIDTQSALSEFQQCLQAYCSNVTTDEEFVDCYLEQCTAETVACFYGCVSTPTQNPVANKAALDACVADECGSVSFNACLNSVCLDEQVQCSFDGDSTCEQGWFGCYTQCATGDAGADCRSACIDSLSVEGAYDLFKWESCRFDLCDSDDDGSMDSNECAQIAYLFGCADVMGTCVAEWPGAGTCAQTTECLIGCGSFGDAAWDCMMPCFEGMGPGAAVTVGPLWSCAVSACGTTANALTVACVLDAMTGACISEANACGYSAPTP